MSNDATWSRISGGLYGQLRRLAAGRLRRERAGHTLSATALVHEVYLRMVEQEPAVDRPRFLATAAVMMRRILVSHARARIADKRGGALRPITLDDETRGHAVDLDQVINLDALIARLEGLHERQAQVVVYRVFGGLTDEEIGEVLEVSTPTVRRDWRVARAWLVKELA